MAGWGSSSRPSARRQRRGKRVVARGMVWDRFTSCRTRGRGRLPGKLRARTKRGARSTRFLPNVGATDLRRVGTLLTLAGPVAPFQRRTVTPVRSLFPSTPGSSARLGVESRGGDRVGSRTKATTLGFDPIPPDRATAKLIIRGTLPSFRFPGHCWRQQRLAFCILPRVARSRLVRLQPRAHPARSSSE